MGASAPTRVRSPKKSVPLMSHLRPTFLHRRRSITGNPYFGERTFRRRSHRDSESGFLSFPSAVVHCFCSDFGWAIMWVESQTSIHESRVFTVIDRKKTMEQLEEVSHAVEPEKPSSKSWLYIFGAVILIFGLTFIFQQMSGTTTGEVRPADIESLQAEIAELRGTVSDLEARIDALENE